MAESMSMADFPGWRRHPGIWSYGIPVLSVGVVLIAEHWLDLYFSAAPVSLFIGAVALSAWLGGFGPGLLATALSLLTFKYFFVPPFHSLVLVTAEAPRLVLFALTALFVGALSAGQRSATVALRESEQRFRDYAETATDWLWETGPDHSFTRLLSGNVAPPGVAPESRIGTIRRDFATDVEEEPEKWRAHMATLEAHQPFHNFVYRTAAADGSAVYASVSGRPMFDAKGRFLGYRGVATNITSTVRAEQAEKALHQTQAELARVTRVTALGELAASIAHEVNQPLAAIGADANACLHWLAADRPDLDCVRDTLACIVKDSQRAGEVIARIRALLARSSVAHEPCDLNGVIQDVLPLIGPEITRHGIRLLTWLDRALPKVMGDRIQLQQVLLNLLSNAVEAVREVPEDQRRLAVRSTFDQREDGLWAVIEVEDTGIGFGEAESARLFDAFYTTKTGGLGMGLSISRSIAESHHGRLWATANSARGATFHLALPGTQ
jgi:PAS domain S-box-containing protein